MYNVLWLASWYPNKTDPFTGDFIERHAAAVSSFVKLTVLFIVKDETLDIGKIVFEKTIEKNVTVYRVYYGTTSANKILEKIGSFKRFRQLQKYYYKQIVEEQGKPDLVHVHVAMRAGLLARYLKKKFNTRYVVTEHWSGYFKESTPNVFTGNLLLNRLNKKILQKADLLFPVTENLGFIINNDFVPVKYQVIPNVVDTGLFFHCPSRPARFRFIHPSMMNENKNPKGILQACALVKSKGYDFELLMVGNLDKILIDLTDRLELNANIVFQQAIPYAEVAREMQHSSALILFSYFESLPCVILEALCCGLPVISSRVGGISEVVNESNGILIERGNIEQLAQAMCIMMKKYTTYNGNNISEWAIGKFNYDTVGTEYVAAYQKLLQLV